MRYRFTAAAGIAALLLTLGAGGAEAAKTKPRKRDVLVVSNNWAGTADVVDASVALIAKRAQALVVTSDTGDFRRLDPSLKVESI